MRVDTSAWSEFRIGDLFELHKGTRLTKASMIEGDIRFVSAANINNGVTAHIGNNERIHSEGTISVCYNGNGGTGKAFYQDKPYWASDDVHVLYPKFNLPESLDGVEWTGLNSTVGLFLAAAIEKVGRQKYGFTDKWKLEYMREDKIKLPVKEDGAPDWEYIEQCMEQIIQFESSYLDELEGLDASGSPVRIASWKRYRLKDIFVMRNTKSIVGGAVNPDSGDTPYVTAKADNNGIATCIDCPAEWLERGGCILIGGKTMTFSYQEQSFCSNDSHNIALYPKVSGLAKEVFLFLIPALKNALGSKYTWSDSISMKSIVEDVVSLPAQPNGDPDWGYMEEFMRRIMLEANSELDALTIITNNDDISG